MVKTTVEHVIELVYDVFVVGLGREAMAVRNQGVAQLTVVLDDPVEDDRELARVAAGQRMRVQLGDASVRRPARMTETVSRCRAVRSCRIDKVLEVAYCTDIVEPALFAERDAGRVVAAVLESAKTAKQQWLGLPR